MDYDVTLPISLVLVSSYLIALWASRNRVRPRVESYLFSGNTPLLALSSNIGAMFSLTVAFTALISAGYVFGSQLAIPMSLGALCALFVLLRVSRREEVIDFLSTSNSRGWSGGASYLAFLGNYFTGTSYLLYYAFALVVYIALTITEFAVFRVTLAALAPSLDSPEIVLILLMTLFICFSYVFIGGYRGGLITDFFQLLIIIAFLGSIATSFDLRHFVRALPSPFRGKVLSGFAGELFILYLGCFVGGFSIAMMSIDQWYRTLGTLPVAHARKVLACGLILICVGNMVPILIGSHALTLHGLPPNLTNAISTFLLLRLLKLA
ncbi:MAG: hypothetical protein JOZ15_08080, partial [Acidobacteria bacterium]|nr:hypothetical protein [Acidobacteriota bacterium]